MLYPPPEPIEAEVWTAMPAEFRALSPAPPTLGTDELAAARQSVAARA